MKDLRVGTFCIYDTGVNVWEETCSPFAAPEQQPMYRAFRALLGRMVNRGFFVERDPEVARNFPTLSAGHYLGRKGDLHVEVELSGRHLKVDFYQERNVENRHGGRYDFNKYGRMWPELRLQCIVELRNVLVKLREMGYRYHRRRRPVESGEVPSLLEVRDQMDPTVSRRWGTLDSFNEQWNSDFDLARGGRFERDETGWPSAKVLSSWPNLDRDGVPIRTGDVVYTRVDGRLIRGVATPNMNNMWCVGGITFKSARALFRCERPDLEPRRLVPARRARLLSELDKAVKAQDYRRVRALGDVLSRVA